MTVSPDGRCGYVLSEEYEVSDDLQHTGCCWRKTVHGTGRCIWHADPDQVDKTSEALQDARVSPEIRDQTSPFAELLDGAKLSNVKLSNTIPFDRIALRRADLSHANLENANLSYADLQYADLTRADLGHANLLKANLRKSILIDIDLSEANLKDVTLSEADFHDFFSKGRADLSQATLKNADLSEAILINADLSNTVLEDADLLSAHLRGANLLGAILNDADLRSILNQSDLRETNLKETHRLPKSLKGANLSGLDLRNVNLSKANLSNADLSGINFSGANLSGADLSNADLSGADLSNADLSGADLSNADLLVSSLRGASLSKCNVNEINVGQSIELDAGTRVSPSGLNPFMGGFYNKSDDWDKLARGYEKLRAIFREAGLEEQHRKLFQYQRRAREKQAHKQGYWLRSIGYRLSRYLTGYGVRVVNVVFWTVTVIMLPAFWYWFVTWWTAESFHGGPLYYSIVTFVTSPPALPPELTKIMHLVTQVIVLMQTYFGTALIILLGYVLSNRDPV